MVYAHVPATTDTEIVAFGDYMDEAFIVFELVDSFCGSVCGVVVNNDEVELEVCLLT